MSNAREISLGDALETLIDHRGKTPAKLGGELTDSGIRVISAINIKNRRVDNDNLRYVSEDTYDRWMPEKLKAGDVLLTSEAPLGELAYLSSDTQACLGQRLFALRPRSEILNGRFLFYLLTSGDARDQLLSRATGSTVSGIRQSELIQIKLHLPPVVEQRAIAGVLGALDDKIESNRRAAALAESILMQIANAAMDLPHVELRELVLAHRDQIDPSKIEADSVDHFSIPAFDTDRLPGTCSPSSIKSGKLEIKYPSTLFSRLNPGTPRLWFGVPGERSALASTEFLIMTDRNGEAPGRNWIAVQSSSFLSEAERRATGTSFSHQRVRPDDALEILVPDTRLLSSQVAAEADDLLNVAHQCRIESRSLAKIRDTLLPELLSGRVRVRDAESMAEEVL